MRIEVSLEVEPVLVDPRLNRVDTPKPFASVPKNKPKFEMKTKNNENKDQGSTGFEPCPSAARQRSSCDADRRRGGRAACRRSDTSAGPLAAAAAPPRRPSSSQSTLRTTPRAQLNQMKRVQLRSTEEIAF